MGKRVDWYIILAIEITIVNLHPSNFIFYIKLYNFLKACNNEIKRNQENYLID